MTRAHAAAGKSSSFAAVKWTPTEGAPTFRRHFGDDTAPRRHELLLDATRGLLAMEAD
jgi:hypothetical protein